MAAADYSVEEKVQLYLPRTKFSSLSAALAISISRGSISILLVGYVLHENSPVREHVNLGPLPSKILDLIHDSAHMYL